MSLGINIFVLNSSVPIRKNILLYKFLTTLKYKKNKSIGTTIKLSAHDSYPKILSNGTYLESSTYKIYNLYF